MTNANAPQITCNHCDSQQRTSSSSGHRPNDLSRSQWLKEIAVIRLLRTAGRECQATGKFSSSKIISAVHEWAAVIFLPVCSHRSLKTETRCVRGFEMSVELLEFDKKKKVPIDFVGTCTVN